MIRNNPSNTLPSSVPPPVMRFESSNLPLTHIVSLRSKLSQIIESLNALTYTIDADGRPGMSSWPEILSKYNNLLTQSHTLINTLAGAHIPQPPRRAGEARRERINPFETIALHPLIMSGSNPPASTTAPTNTGPTVNGATTTTSNAGQSAVFDETHHGMLENLLRTDPHSEVIKRWDETVRRFVERRKGGTQVEPQDVLKEMIAIKEGHDARIERAMKVVEDLKDKWDWKMRVTLDDPFEEDDDDDDDEEDLFGDDDMEPAAPTVWDGTPKQVAAVQIPSQSDEVMRTQSQSTRMPTQSDEVMAAQSQTMDYSQNQSQSQTAMDVSSVDSSQPPPPTQVPPTQDTDMLFISDDSDDDGDLEDVMES